MKYEKNFNVDVFRIGKKFSNARLVSVSHSLNLPDSDVSLGVFVFTCYSYTYIYTHTGKGELCPPSS